MPRPKQHKPNPYTDFADDVLRLEALKHLEVQITIRRALITAGTVVSSLIGLGIFLLKSGWPTMI